MDGLWNVFMSSEYHSKVVSSHYLVQSEASIHSNRRRNISESPDKDPHRRWLSMWPTHRGPRIISQGRRSSFIKTNLSPRDHNVCQYLLIFSIYCGNCRPDQIGKHDEFEMWISFSDTTSWPGSMIVFRPNSVKWRNYAPGPPSVSSWTCFTQVIKTSLEIIKMQDKSIKSVGKKLLPMLLAEWQSLLIE